MSAHGIERMTAEILFLWYQIGKLFHSSVTESASRHGDAQVTPARARHIGGWSFLKSAVVRSKRRSTYNSTLVAASLRSQMLYPVELGAPEKNREFAEEQRGGQIIQKRWKNFPAAFASPRSA